MHSALSMKHEYHKFLAIRVQGLGFGIPIHAVREIVFHSPINPLPQTPAYVRGVTLVRDETIPVLDLSIMLGNKEAIEVHDESCFIIIQLADSAGELTKICLLGDHILQTYTIDNDAVDAPPMVANENVIDYMLGAGRVGDEMFILIDPAKFISPLLDTVTPYLAYNKDAQLKNEAKIVQQKQKYMFLPVFCANEEYAFPLSSVVRIMEKNTLTDYDGDDIPDALDNAFIYDNKPVGILNLSNMIIRHGEQANGAGESISTYNKASREVVVLIEFNDGLLGIIVDQIGSTYSSHCELKKNSFCSDLPRSRVKSNGFINNGEKSIEAIDPIGLLTEKEQKSVIAWMRCIQSLVEISDSQSRSNQKIKNEKENPLYKHAGTYLIIQIGNEFIGLKSAHVDEVMSYDKLMPLHGGPSWFLGLLNLRNNTYPVIDLQDKLDIDACDDPEENRNVLVMVNDSSTKIGITADKIIHTIKISTEQLHDTNIATLLVQPTCLDAVARVNNDVIHIINLKKVIESKNISVRNLVNEIEKQNTSNTSTSSIT